MNTNLKFSVLFIVIKKWVGAVKMMKKPYVHLSGCQIACLMLMTDKSHVDIVNIKIILILHYYITFEFFWSAQKMNWCPGGPLSYIPSVES